MRLLPRYLFVWVIVIAVSVPGFGQINPIKTAKEIGKNLPLKREQPNSSSPNSSTTTTTTTTSNVPSTSGNATPPPDPAVESSPAKSFIASFWKAIDKLKNASATQQYSQFNSAISSAETNLKNISMRDPAYNTKPLEAELAKYKEEYQAYNDKRSSDRNNMVNSIGVLDEVFKGNLTTVPYTGNVDADIAAHKTKIEAFHNKVNEFLSGNPDQRILKDRENQVNTEAGTVPEQVKKYESSLNTQIGKQGLMLHRELLALEAHWDAVSKIYPQLDAPKSAQQNIKAALARVGTEAQMLAKFQQNLTERIKNARMPAAIHSNTSIEAEFKKAFANTGWGESILKINLLSNDWSTLYHNISGNVVGRTYRAAIGAKQPNGNCIIYDFSIVQEHTGAGNYGSSKRYAHGVFADQCLCENLR